MIRGIILAAALLGVGLLATQAGGVAPVEAQTACSEGYVLLAGKCVPQGVTPTPAPTPPVVCTDTGLTTGGTPNFRIIKCSNGTVVYVPTS